MFHQLCLKERCRNFSVSNVFRVSLVLYDLWSSSASPRLRKCNQHFLEQINELRNFLTTTAATSFCITVLPDVWLKDGESGKISMRMVSPALRPCPLSFAASLRGSNLGNLWVSNAVCQQWRTLTAQGTKGNHTGLSPAHRIHHQDHHCSCLFISTMHLLLDSASVHLFKGPIVFDLLQQKT